tara:strand:- start:1227 stop:4481 length:3255 start_codon:yes stop_codon:yes gene_type:complete
MLVRKRNGTEEPVSKAKIHKFLRHAGPSSEKLIDTIVMGMPRRIDSSSLNTYFANTVQAAGHGDMAGRIEMLDLHKITSSSFTEAMLSLPLDTEFQQKISSLDLDKFIRHENDFTYDLFALRTLQRSYLMRDEDNRIVERPQYMLMRVAASLYDTEDDIVTCYNALSDKLYTHATPTLFNAGTKNGQYASCFLGVMQDDSILGIFNTVKQCALISKTAGGIGMSISNIRATGAHIQGAMGKSNGIVPMLRVFNETARYVDQGRRRKGSFAMYLEPWHMDIEAFLELRKNHGDENAKARDLFTALWVPDLFMERVRDNREWTLFCPTSVNLQDVHSDAFKARYEEAERHLPGKQIMARDLWEKIIRTQIETGTPYIMYKDRVNSCSNQQHLGTIRGSNLCVAAETRILTDNGWFQIKTLENEQVNVWNGEAFTPTTVKKTGHSELLKVTCSNGTTLHCTPYHKFYIQKSYHAKTPLCKRAHELEPGMKLIKCNYPTIKRGKRFKYPYTHGLFCADGTYHKSKESTKRCSYKADDLCGRHQQHICVYPEDGTCRAQTYVKNPSIALYGEKQTLMKYLNIRSTTGKINDNRINVLLPHDIEDKFRVPINACLEDKLLWLAGYLDGDGCVLNNNGCQTIQAVSTHQTFLNDIKLMLQTIGVHSAVKICRNERYNSLPDGHGGTKTYLCKELFRLLIASNECQHLLGLGLNMHRLHIVEYSPQRSATKFVKIVSVEKTERKEDTFCFKEMERGMGIFEGIITGQCAEVTEYTSPDEIAVCTLASIALPSFMEETFDFDKLGNTVEQVVRNLDSVIDTTYYPLKEAKLSNMRHRPMGIGVQGLADLIQMNKMAYDSEEAVQFDANIFETMYYHALKASCQLAREKGPHDSFVGSPASKGVLQFDFFDLIPTRYDWQGLKDDIMQHGLRNSLLISVMPTASTAQILGNSEGTDPRTSNLYNRRVLSGEFMVENHVLRSQVDNWQEVKKALLRDYGSVQKAPVSDEIKARFKTVWEMSQKWVIKHAAARQPFICQSQSMNLFLPEPTVNQVNAMHFYAWNSKLKTGLYYLRTRPKVNPVQINREPECESCSA